MIATTGPNLFAMLLAGLVSGTQSAGPSGVWPGSELVWPKDRIGRIWQAHILMAGKGAAGLSWPVAFGALCADLESPQASAGPGLDGATALLAAECREKSAGRPFSLTLGLGAYPEGRPGSLGMTFETFKPGWQSIRVDPEAGEEWSNLPPAANAELRYPVSPHSFLYFRLGLRRDIAAWHRDPLGANLPLSQKEVDLNEPSLGYFHAENSAFSATIGRFPVHWSPSQDFGLALSDAVPFHNAAEFALKMPRIRYRFLVSSLNPWLEGTPPGDTSSEAYPAGSEQYRQRHYPVDHGASNFHNRIYAENIKTLFAHRLEGEIGPLGLGLTESQIIGGKVPDLRDAGPFVVFHDDFKDGYTNSAVSLDATLRLPGGFSLATELYVDDVNYRKTESEGNTASLLGYLAALRHAFTKGGWVFSQSLHAIRTDPFLYGYLQPLSTMASRHVLASNNQRESDAVFVDRYVVDYPIGYLRGGDAFDFWYRLEAWRDPGLRLNATLAWLSQGQVDLSTPYQDYYRTGHGSPSGIAEKELRLGLGGAYAFPIGLSVDADVNWRMIRNRGHVSGKDVSQGELAIGTFYSFPARRGR